MTVTCELAQVQFRPIRLRSFLITPLLEKLLSISSHRLFTKTLHQGYHSGGQRVTNCDMEAFFDWFERRNGYIDKSAMTIGDIPGCARGAIALRDLPVSNESLARANKSSTLGDAQEGHTLFTIPRDLTLSTRTSALPSKLGMSTCKQYCLHVGWAGLILCMMWEEAQGAESKWNGYMCKCSKYFAVCCVVYNAQYALPQRYYLPNSTHLCSGMRPSWKN